MRLNIRVQWNSANKGLPLPLGRGGCETKSKSGRARPRKHSISQIFCAQRGIETVVSEGARPWGRGRSGDCEKCGNCLRVGGRSKNASSGKVCAHFQAISTSPSLRFTVPFGAHPHSCSCCWWLCTADSWRCSTLLGKRGSSSIWSLAVIPCTGGFQRPVFVWCF